MSISIHVMSIDRSWHLDGLEFAEQPRCLPDHHQARHATHNEGTNTTLPFMPSLSAIDWKGAPFTGDIPHHGDSGHLRRASAIYLSAKLEKMAEAAVTEEDRKALSSLASQVSSVIDSNFKTSGEHAPESFGGELGFSGDVRHRGQGH